MNWRFQWLYRLVLAAFFFGVGWSLWAQTFAVIAPAGAAPGPDFPPNFFQFNLPAHAMSFGLDQFQFLCDHKILDQPLWKYLASLIYLLLALLVARLLNYICNHWLKRLTARTQSKYDDLILELVRGPVEVVALVIFLNIGLGIFDWPPRAQLFLSHAFMIIVACSLTYVALKLVDLVLGLWREKFVSPQDRVFANQLIPLLSKSAKIAIVIAAVMLTAENMQWEIKSLLAGLSVGGLALGLAAQDTVANLFGAVAIFLDKPFYVGDRIKVESVEGVVESIGLRSTRVCNNDGHHITVPNKLMGNAIITNITRRPSIRTEMNFGLPYHTATPQLRRATELLTEIFRANPKTGDLLVSFNKFTDCTLNISVVHVWNGTDAKAHLAEMQEMNLQIKQRFEAEKIEFAFPTQTIHLKTDAAK